MRFALPARRGASLGLGAIILASAILAPSLAARADDGDLTVPPPKCPSDVAAVGFPVDNSPLVSPGDVLTAFEPLPPGISIDRDHLIGARLPLGTPLSTSW